MVTTTDDSFFGPTLVPDGDPNRPRPMEWTHYRAAVLKLWRALLDSDPEEPKVQEFLELHPSMVPGGSGDVGPGGHHGSEFGALFRQPDLKGLGASFRPDFMWVTRASGLVTPILIEIEKPSKRWFNKNGTPTAHFSQAHHQLNQWRIWFERPQNAEIFRQEYVFLDSFRRRPMKPQFLLIYGRGSEFEPGGPHQYPHALYETREGMRRSDETFRSFDSLVPVRDCASAMTVSKLPEGPKVHALSPLFETHANCGGDALILGDLDDALSRTVMMSDLRKDYIAQRWSHWRNVEIAVRADAKKVYPHQGGGE